MEQPEGGTGVLDGPGTVVRRRDVVVVSAGPVPEALRTLLDAGGDAGASLGSSLGGPPSSAASGAASTADLQDRLAAIVVAGPGLGAVLRTAQGWRAAAGAGVRVQATHIGYRAVHDGPWAGALPDVTRVVVAPATLGDALPREALPPDATASGGGAVVDCEPAVGVPPPLVDAVTCRCGAFVHPLTVRCRACRSLLSGPRHRIVGPPVPVGRLVLDDGRSLPLLGDVVVGRDPRQDPAVTSGAAAALALSDSERSVSRAHLALRRAGWDVLLEDREAANGTAVRPASSGDWTVLVPGACVRLLPGTEVRLGRRRLRLT